MAHFVRNVALSAARSGAGLACAIDTTKNVRPIKSTSSINESGDTVVEQNPNNLLWGFALEYSIPYLQSFVRDMGWQAPFNRLIPIVEFNFSTALNRGQSGTTGTINPGVLWAGQSIQIGIEAMIPVNSRTGSKTGVIAQLHFFLDDILPKSLGKPLFGN